MRGIVVLGLAGILFAGVALETALACWNTVLIECFDRPINQFPWQNPVGSGRVWRVCAVVGSTTYCSPGIPANVARWHPHAGDYFDVLMCPDDDKSLWCYGYPTGNDPEFDDYPANYNTYVTYGRLNLSQAVAARVVWSMWHETELIYDSVYWGASKTQVLSDTGMKIAGSRWQETNEWQIFSMDLADLWNYTTGDSFSFLGEDTVYVFWRFRSNPNNIRGVGTFIDNITVSWDDGLQDLAATTLEILEPDSDYVQDDPNVGDSLIAHFAWNVCEGAVDTYDPFHIILAVNETTIFDTLIEEAHAGDIRHYYTVPWVVTEPGNFNVRLKVDSLNQIPENNENNNLQTATYFVPTPNPPATFVWITPSTDTLVADTTAVIRWSAIDPDEQATVSIYYDNESIGCVGVAVPGGSLRPELDGIDSVTWDVQSLPNNRTYYLFARVFDAVNDTCIYAPYPLVIDHTHAAGERPSGLVPEAYFLDQNYPNPFNPATEIRYGIKLPGEVTLAVYDVLGREVAVLVNERLEPGSYATVFDGTAFPSGIYMYVLTTPEGTIGRKMMLLK